MTLGLYRLDSQRSESRIEINAKEDCAQIIISGSTGDDEGTRKGLSR